MGDSRDLHYLHLQPGQALPAVPRHRPCRVVVVIEADVSADWRSAVSDWIVASGCLYMMAWGIECGAWDDSVDWSTIPASKLQTGDHPLVMTTWHEDESLQEAFFYCEFNAGLSSDGVALDHKLILHVADTADESRMRSEYAAMLATSAAQDRLPHR